MNYTKNFTKSIIAIVFSLITIIGYGLIAYASFNDTLYNKTQDNFGKISNCVAREWQWNITRPENTGNQGGAPDHILVSFSSGDVLVELTNLTSVAQYRWTSNLTDTLASPGARVEIKNPIGRGSGRWNGQFILSHGPCIKPLRISKTATTTFDRYWSWEIDKTVDQQTFIQSEEPQDINYSAKVTATSTDNYTVSGVIKITNPSRTENSTITSVIDQISGLTTVTSVVCRDSNNQEINFNPPYVLGPGKMIICTYSESLPNGETRENIVEVTTSQGVKGGSASAPIVFSDPNETNKCVEVWDTMIGNDPVMLGMVCAEFAEEGVVYVETNQFDYVKKFGKPGSGEVDVEVEPCGTGDYINTAEVRTKVSGEEEQEVLSSDSASVRVDSDCSCSLSMGYWKTHSSNGPAPYDTLWAPYENVIFFYSGNTYYGVMQINPSGGNAYYQLAHQYIATKLNVSGGVVLPVSVLSAFNSATSLFNNPANTPSAIGALTGSSLLRQQFINLASILDGFIGENHCEG
jgi:hypothetical protein